VRKRGEGGARESREQGQFHITHHCSCCGNLAGGGSSVGGYSSPAPPRKYYSSDLNFRQHRGMGRTGSKGLKLK